MNRHHLIPEPDAKTAYFLNVSDIIFFPSLFSRKKKKKILSMVLPMTTTPPSAFLEEINCIIQGFSENLLCI